MCKTKAYGTMAVHTSRTHLTNPTYIPSKFRLGIRVVIGSLAFLLPCFAFADSMQQVALHPRSPKRRLNTEYQMHKRLRKVCPFERGRTFRSRLLPLTERGGTNIEKLGGVICAIRPDRFPSSLCTLRTQRGRWALLGNLSLRFPV